MNNIIPKTIHYIWLGSKEMPWYMTGFLNKTKRVLKGYKIIVWKDKDVALFYNDSDFVKDALKEKRYAFLSDYLRLSILEQYGGIYLDTDVFVKKNLDRFLKYKIVLGNIVDSSLGTAFIGSQPHNMELKKWLLYMENCYEKTRLFKANNHWMTQYFLDHYADFRLDGKKQILKNGIAIFPKTFFESSKPFFVFCGGYCVHMCEGSWHKPNIPILKEDCSLNRAHKTIFFLPKKIKSLYCSSFFYKQKLAIRDYILHVKQNRFYPFYNVYKKHKRKNYNRLK